MGEQLRRRLDAALDGTADRGPSERALSWRLRVCVVTEEKAEQLTGSFTHALTVDHAYAGSTK